MDFVVSSLGFRWRSVVAVSGITAAAFISCFLLHRGQQKQQQRRPSLERQQRGLPVHDAAVQTEEVQEPPAATDIQLEDELLEFGPLIPFRDEFPQEVQRAYRTVEHSWVQRYSNTLKLVKVSLQHKAIYTGLESEHWWQLANDFYDLHPELPPQYFANVKAVACIKKVGHQVSEVNVHLSTESSNTSLVQMNFMDYIQTKMSKTFKGVSIGEDGCFRSSETSDTQILENPVVQPSTKRPGPPPGFH